MMPVLRDLHKDVKDFPVSHLLGDLATRNLSDGTEITSLERDSVTTSLSRDMAGNNHLIGRFNNNNNSNKFIYSSYQ